jgi:hypothetical protein
MLTLKANKSMCSTSKPILTYDGQRWHESIIEIYSSGNGREHD